MSALIERVRFFPAGQVARYISARSMPLLPTRERSYPALMMFHSVFEEVSCNRGFHGQQLEPATKYEDPEVVPMNTPA